jgi:hypothetical protein
MPAYTKAVDQFTIRDELRLLVSYKYEWDTPPGFYIFERNEKTIVLAAEGVMAVDPEKIPDVMAAITADTVGDGANPYLLVVRVEAYRVTDRRVDRGPDYAEQFDRDAVARAFSTRPDSVETVTVWAVDRNFRLWVAEKYRGSTTISEHFYPMGAQAVISGHVMVSMFSIIEALNNTPGIFFAREAF